MPNPKIYVKNVLFPYLETVISGHIQIGTFIFQMGMMGLLWHNSTYYIVGDLCTSILSLETGIWPSCVYYAHNLKDTRVSCPFWYAIGIYYDKKPHLSIYLKKEYPRSKCVRRSISSLFDTMILNQFYEKG